MDPQRKTQNNRIHKFTGPPITTTRLTIHKFTCNAFTDHEPPIVNYIPQITDSLIHKFHRFINRQTMTSDLAQNLREYLRRFGSDAEAWVTDLASRCTRRRIRAQVAAGLDSKERGGSGDLIGEVAARQDLIGDGTAELVEKRREGRRVLEQRCVDGDDGIEDRRRQRLDLELGRRIWSREAAQQTEMRMEMEAAGGSDERCGETSKLVGDERRIRSSVGRRKMLIACGVVM